jgi:hypothetical protein
MIFDDLFRERYPVANAFPGQPAHPSIVRAIRAQAERSTQFLLPTEVSVEVAEELARRYPVSMWQFTLSATQANTEAIRLARGVTGREKTPRVVRSRTVAVGRHPIRLAALRTVAQLQAGDAEQSISSLMPHIDACVQEGDMQLLTDLGPVLLPVLQNAWNWSRRNGGSSRLRHALSTTMTELSRAVLLRKQLAIGLASERDLSQSVAWHAAILLGLASEADQARAVAGRHALVAAGEADAARLIGRIIGLGRAQEADLAQQLVLAAFLLDGVIEATVVSLMPARTIAALILSRELLSLNQARTVEAA